LSGLRVKGVRTKVKGLQVDKWHMLAEAPISAYHRIAPIPSQWTPVASK
jgi:hypothetical protein